MKLHEPEAQREDWDNAATILPGPSSPLAAIGDFFSKTFTIVEWEVLKLRHDPTDIVVRSVQPALWLLIFGEVFTRTHAIPTGNVSYLEVMAPGILAQSVLIIP